MAAIKQYPLQLHEEIITLCCVEPKSLRHFFETGCSSSTPSFTCPWTLRLIKEKAGKVGHRGAAIFHLSSGAADQRVNAKVLKLLLERIFDDSPFFARRGCVLVCLSAESTMATTEVSQIFPFEKKWLHIDTTAQCNFMGGWGGENK